MGSKPSKQSQPHDDQVQDKPQQLPNQSDHHGQQADNVDLTHKLPIDQDKQESDCHVLADARQDVKCDDGLSLKLFRKEHSVHGQHRKQLAMTLRGTVRQRRDRVRQGLATEPMLRDIVQLPSGQLLNDWIAVNTIHFYNVVSIVYGSLSDYCTDYSCPIMAAGSKYQYLWSDSSSPDAEVQEVSAPVYVNMLFDWIESMLSNESIFPRDNDHYPLDYFEQVSTIFRRIFRVYAHIYYSHFDQIRSSGAELHLNSSFQHFAFFACEFGLLHTGDMAPLQRLLKKLLPGFSE